MFAKVFEREARRLGQQNMTIESAAWRKSGSNQLADVRWSDLVDETGIDLSSHKSRWIGNLVLSSYDHILCMDADTLIEVRKMTRRLTKNNTARLVNPPYGIPNPWGEDLDTYRASYKLMEDIAGQIPPEH